MNPASVNLPVCPPVFSATTDCLIGAVPAAANPTVRNWYCAHAVALTVHGQRIGIKNSGWRANPYLCTVEEHPTGNPQDPVLSLLNEGYYVAFCGLHSGALPEAGLICGMSGQKFRVLISAPDGTVREGALGIAEFATGRPRVVRGLRVHPDTVPFDRQAACAELGAYLISQDRTAAIRLSDTADPRTRVLLTEHRRVICGTLRRLGAGRDLFARYLDEVLPKCTPSAWAAEEEILFRALTQG